MKKTLAAGTVLFALCAHAAEPPKDAGLVTSVTGTVTFSSAVRSSPAPVTSFMKMRNGDHCQLAADSTLVIVFFTGREETWSGPAALSVGATSATAAKGKKPAVRAVEPLESANLAKLPSMMRAVRAGAVTVRSGNDLLPEIALTNEEKDELAAARSAWESRRKSAAESDVLPDLAYLGTLNEYQRWNEMSEVTAAALVRAPANDDLKAIRSWLDTKKMPGP